MDIRVKLCFDVFDSECWWEWQLVERYKNGNSKVYARSKDFETRSQVIRAAKVVSKKLKLPYFVDDK